MGLLSQHADCSGLKLLLTHLAYTTYIYLPPLATPSMNDILFSNPSKPKFKITSALQVLLNQTIKITCCRNPA